LFFRWKLRAGLHGRGYEETAAALALDLRTPQDYFHRVWSTAFRAADLAAHGDDEYSGEELAEACA
jgi:hypothetical protein